MKFIFQVQADVLFNYRLRKLMEDKILVEIVLLKAKPNNKFRSASQEYPDIQRFGFLYLRQKFQYGFYIIFLFIFIQCINYKNNSCQFNLVQTKQ